MPESLKQTKIVQLVKRETVNEETGQIVRSEKESVLRLPQEPEYVKLYLQDLSHLLDVPTGPQGLLMRLVRKLDYDGIITLTSASRDRIAASLEIKPHTLANYLTALCEKGILRRTGRGEYEMNPHLMAKGTWSDILQRRAEFTLCVTYRPDGSRTIKSSVADQGSLALVDGE